jgi:hypothetical protein
MINELVIVAKAMEDAGVSAKDWHPRLKPLKKVSRKEPSIRIWLTSEGRIYDIELLPADLASQLRKFEPDAGKSLPGFNVCPLYRIVKSDKDLKNAAKVLTDALTKGDCPWDNVVAEGEDFWARTRSVLKQLKERVLPDMREMCSANLKPDETLARFFDAFGKIDIEQFRDDYAEKAKAKVKVGTLPPSLICYFVDEKKKSQEDSDTNSPIPKSQVFLDVKDYTDYPVAHPETVSRLNELLMAADSTGGKVETGQSHEVMDCDAYGKNANGTNEKFSEVRVPFLAGVILRSQVAAVPAQSRYHLCESDTFPVGSQTRKQIKAALEWISSSDRYGDTFGVAGDKELLFAFPSKLPASKVPIASLFGVRGQQVDATLNMEKFERLAQTVISQLKGTGKAATEATELNIFSLRKMDKARTKVVYYRNITIDSLEEASKDWHEGFQNVPVLDIRDWSVTKNDKGKNFPVFVETLTLFPLELHNILNTVWTFDKDAPRQSKVKIFTPSVGLRLLLDSPDVASVTHVAERFLSHAQTYFVTLCRAKGKNEVAKLPDKNLYPGILGLLLYKLGKNKETYMNESAYQLGRFLRVADEIHRLYCEIVRKKDLPPELCGSSLLTSMLEAPARTIDQLAMRAAPYVKWAKAFHDSDKAGLVHYWMHQWSQIADTLHEVKWPSRPTPEERAQIFLGYLSSFKKAESSETVSNDGEQK